MYGYMDVGMDGFLIVTVPFAEYYKYTVVIVQNLDL